MATYYRWDKYGKRKVTIETALGPVKITIGEDTAYNYSCGFDSDAGGEYLKILGLFNPPTIKNGQYLNFPKSTWTGFSAVSLDSGAHIDEAYKYDSSSFRADMSGGVITVNNTLQKATTARERVGYVYSTSPTSFPNGGESGAYYYSGRTTVISPTAPPSLSYPAKILSSEVTVSWPAASSNTNYAVTAYELNYSTNGGSSWTVAGTTSGTSMSVEIPAGATSIRFRVRAKDTNGQWSDYRTGTESQVLLPPTITVPIIVMQAQPITVNWTSITGASSYTLQRKADTDEDWTQVYSGDNLTFTESAGTWTSVQYRVQAVFDATPGGWATSETIPVIASSSLVISGQDEDLGTITSDIPYSVATDTGNQISLTRTVNGVLVASLTVDGGFAYSIPVMDLPTGTGTIVITATVQTSSGPVTVTRTWTYTKQAQTFPGSGGLAQLAQDGQNMFPLTLAEAVKTISGPWGGNLSTALDKLAKAAVFNRESVPKYTEVKVDLSQITTQDAKNGKIIMLPYQGKMVPHIVVHVGNPDPSMYDASCNGVWLLRKDIVENGPWNSTNVNTLYGSTIMTAMQKYVADYDSSVQAAIKTVKIPYCIGNGDWTVRSGSNGLECKVFPLSECEVGGSDSNVPIDGAKLDYFLTGGNEPSANAKRIFEYEGSPSRLLLRNIYKINTYFCGTCGETGVLGQWFCRDSAGYLPCFILPTTFQATYLVGSGNTVHSEQEYTTAGDFADLWGNTIPTVKIETGSYTGTGTYGSSNPNKLTFVFPPKLVLVFTGSLETFMIIPAFAENPDGYGSSFVRGGSNTCQVYEVAKTVDGNSLSWWVNGITQPHIQFNYSGRTYNYIAIG